MRIISQRKAIDIDYETSSFMITDECDIIAITNVSDRFRMAHYSTIEKARKALTAMSNNYIRYLITDTDGHMYMTDALDCEIDKPFNKIEVKEMKATVYKFPEEDQI